MSPLTLIVAATRQNGIGRSGTMPWYIPKDLSYFSQVTTNTPATQVNALFMGRKTWESIPLRFRPLKKRTNVVLSHNDDYDLFRGDPTTFSQADSSHLYFNLKDAVEDFGSQNKVHRLFIIGGSSLYQEALGLANHNHSNRSSLQVDRILMTRIHNPEFDCDVFFPDVLGGAEWIKASHEEHSAWAGLEVPTGIQTENGIEFEFQMWVRASGGERE